MSVPRVAITMGDPAGVGPEIIVKACRALAPRVQQGELRLVVIGRRAALDAAQAVLGAASGIAEAAEGADWPDLAFLAAGEEREPVRFGEISAEAGRFAYLAVERAVRLAQAREVAAIVTAPLNKEALNRAGHHYAGHTEMLAALTGVRGSVMLLAHGPMRVSHVTTHVALADVPRLLTPERLRRVIDLTHAALRDLGLERQPARSLDDPCARAHAKESGAASQTKAKLGRLRAAAEEFATYLRHNAGQVVNYV